MDSNCEWGLSVPIAGLSTRMGENRCGQASIPSWASLSFLQWGCLHSGKLCSPSGSAIHKAPCSSHWTLPIHSVSRWPAAAVGRAGKLKMRENTKGWSEWSSYPEGNSQQTLGALIWTIVRLLRCGSGLGTRLLNTSGRCEPCTLPASPSRPPPRPAPLPHWGDMGTVTYDMCWHSSFTRQLVPCRQNTGSCTFTKKAKVFLGAKYTEQRGVHLPGRIPVGIEKAKKTGGKFWRQMSLMLSYSRQRGG